MYLNKRDPLAVKVLDEVFTWEEFPAQVFNRQFSNYLLFEWDLFFTGDTYTFLGEIDFFQQYPEFYISAMVDDNMPFFHFNFNVHSEQEFINIGRRSSDSSEIGMINENEKICGFEKGLHYALYGDRYYQLMVIGLNADVKVDEVIPTEMRTLNYLQLIFDDAAIEQFTINYINRKS